VAGASPDRLHRLSWFENGDRLDVAVVTNRLAAAGREIWRWPAQSGAAEAGDYLVELSPQLAEALRRAGIVGPACDRPMLTPAHEPVKKSTLRGVLWGQTAGPAGPDPKSTSKST
jgi:hypothetical protein